MGAPYQMSPELLSKYEKQLADMRSEKGLMTGLSFLTGVLGARTPWMSQAISEGGLQALGTYGRYGEDEHRLQQAMLEQQMGNERAPIEARQKAGLELLKQEAEAGKQATDIKKATLGFGKTIGAANIRADATMRKAQFDRGTQLLKQQMANEAMKTGKPPSPDRAYALAKDLAILDPEFADAVLKKDTARQDQILRRMAGGIHSGAMQLYNGAAGNRNMDNMGGGAPVPRIFQQ